MAPYPQHRAQLAFSTSHALVFPGLDHPGFDTLPSLILVALGTGGSAGVKDKPQKLQPGSAEVEEEDTYYDAMKKEMAGRAERTKAALDALDPQQRIAMAGFRPGAYLRLRFTGGYALSVLISITVHVHALCTCVTLGANLTQERAQNPGCCPAATR